MADESISGEAITKGDLQSLERCLETANIKTVLEFEKRHGESLLHMCVKLAGENCVPLVKRLLASGLVDGDLRDGKGKRFLECAWDSGDLELVSEMIKIHIDGLDDATGCYRMMKCGSLKVFQHYLTLTGWNEQDKFRNVASALVRINVKSIVLPEELRVYLMWLLSDYGYRQLAGNRQGQEDPEEWRRQVDTVLDCWRVVKKTYDTEAYGDVDDGLLHRLEVIHNHLYFLKYQHLLRHLRLQEAVFCLAIFISIYRDASQFDQYRLLLNKCFVIDVLRMVCSQLVAVVEYPLEMEKKLITLINQHAAAGKERLIKEIRKGVPHLRNAEKLVERLDLEKGMDLGRTVQLVQDTVTETISDEKLDLKDLLKPDDHRVVEMLQEQCAQTKQLYSVFKMVSFCNQIPALKDVDPLVWTACMKRVLQVWGETVKNTNKTPNLPGKMQRLMSIMLTPLFAKFSKKLRDILSHSFSLNRLLRNTEEMLDDFESAMYLQANDRFQTLRVALQLLYIIVVIESRNDFYRQLERCGTIESLRSLVLYAGDQKALAGDLQTCLGQIKEYIDEYRKLVEELSTRPGANMATLNLIQQRLKKKDDNIEEVKKFFTENDSYGAVAEACMASTDVASVGRLLSWKLDMRCGDELVHKILFVWMTTTEESRMLQGIDYRLKNYDPSAMLHVLHFNVTALEKNEKLLYMMHTRELTKEIGIADRVDDDALEKLNEKLKRYYDNILFVDEKWKVLEEFCKNRGFSWNKERANELVARDRRRLQKLFDDLRTKLQNVLKANHLSTVEDLYHNVHHLPSYVLAAIEYYQLELCEMLVAVEYLGDSCHYMKHRIPMILAKHYRNCLAHDALSTNILTDSSMEQFVINAFVIANTKIQLFDKRINPATQPDVLGKNFPSVDDTHRWVEEQEQLMTAVRAEDVPRMHALMRAGGEITSRFCCSPNDASVKRSLQPLTELVNPCTAEPAIVRFLNRYFSDFADRCSKPDDQLEMALKMYDFQSALDRSSDDGNVWKHDALFRWPELMASAKEKNLRLFNYLLLTYNRDKTLSKLIKHGNETSVREILQYVDEFHDAEGADLLNDAMLHCVRPIAELLLPRTPVPHVTILELAIIVHWDDFFKQLLGKVKLDSGAYGNLLKTAAQAKNVTATKHLLEQKAYQDYIPAAFEECALMAARRGELLILQELLKYHPVDNPARLATVLQTAALGEHWACVQFLLDAGVPVDVECSGDRTEEKTTLLILVRYGQSRLLDEVTQVDRAIFGQNVDHPFAVALRHGTASDDMIRSLQRLGFDWRDNSMVMNAILKANKSVLKNTPWSVLLRLEEKKEEPTNKKRTNQPEGVQSTGVWDKLKERRRPKSRTKSDRFALTLDVLDRWAAIGFVEETTFDETPLICAVNEYALKNIKDMLYQARMARRIVRVGVLRGVVFEIDSMVIISGKRGTGRSLAFGLQAAAKTMIEQMETMALLEAMQWHQCTIDAAGVSVTVSVLAAIDQMFDQPSVLKCTDQLKVSDPLYENLPVLQSIIRRFFSKYPVVYATFAAFSSSTRHFWQIKDLSCLFDILPPAAAIDLKDTVNYGDSSGETPLHKCFPDGKLFDILLPGPAINLKTTVNYGDSSDETPLHKCSSDGKLSLVTLLVENGANPLLADSSGRTAIHLSLLNAADSASGRYLIDESVARDLRNANGASLVNLVVDTCENTLLHTAVRMGRHDIVERLTKLGENAKAANCAGVSAVRMAFVSGFHNPEKLVEIVLENDSSVIDMQDPEGDTLLHYAANVNSVPLLEVLLKHTPKLTVCNNNGLTPLATAILKRKMDVAKQMLRYAIDKGIKDLTKADNYDLVFHSCFCNCYEFSEALLEYELGHKLSESKAGDLPRIDAILNGVPSRNLEISLLQFVQLCGLNEAQEFVTQLQVLRNSITDQSATVIKAKKIVGAVLGIILVYLVRKYIVLKRNL